MIKLISLLEVKINNPNTLFITDAPEDAQEYITIQIYPYSREKGGIDLSNPNWKGVIFQFDLDIPEETIEYKKLINILKNKGIKPILSSGSGLHFVEVPFDKIKQFTKFGN